MMMPPTRLESTQKFELSVAVAHLAHALLCKLLTPALENSEDPRVVLVSSAGHAAGSAEFIQRFVEYSIFFIVLLLKLSKSFVFLSLSLFFFGS